MFVLQGSWFTAAGSVSELRAQLRSDNVLITSLLWVNVGTGMCHIVEIIIAAEAASLNKLVFDILDTAQPCLFNFKFKLKVWLASVKWNVTKFYQHIFQYPLSQC